MATHILIAAPSPVIQAAIRSRISADAEVLTATSPGETVRLALSNRPQAVVIHLDEGVDAARECEMLRALGSFALIVVWEALPSRVVAACLDAGADGAVQLHSPHFRSQVAAILRHCGADTALATGGRFVIDDLVIDEAAHTVTRGGERINLTPLEFRLLVVLARRLGVVVPTREILVSVWGPEYEDDTQYVRLYVGYLRNKLERDPRAAKLLFTQWGVGYRLGGERASGVAPQGFAAAGA